MKLSSSFESLMILLSFGSLFLITKEGPCKSVGSKDCHDVFIVGHVDQNTPPFFLFNEMDSTDSLDMEDGKA